VSAAGPGFRWWSAAALALCAAFFVMLATGALGQRWTVVVDDYLCWVVPVLAAVACAVRARSRVVRQDRRLCAAWTLMAVSCLAWGAGGLTWAVYEVHLGREVPYPSLADVGYLSAVPPAVVGLVLLSGAGTGWTVRLRDVADGAVAGSALLFISWATVLGPVFYDSELDSWTRLIGLAYPTSDVLTTTIALLAVARARGRHRATLTLLGLGLAAVGVSDSSFTWFTAHGSYQTGNLFDTGYVAAYLLIALAALLPVGGATTAAPERLPGRLALTLPYVPVLAVGVVGVTIGLARQPLGTFLFWDGCLMVGLVLTRQLISLYANQALSHELRLTVTALRQREAELARQAFHDDLTGLPNRAAFHRELTSAMNAGDRAAVMIVDLDGFKAVNDGHGHHAGDLLLTVVAQRLRAAVREDDVVARLGGDEFAVVLRAPSGPSEAAAVATRIHAGLAEPTRIGGTVVAARASIGIAHGEHGTTLDELLRRADAAMYRAKKSGRVEGPPPGHERFLLVGTDGEPRAGSTTT